MGVSLWAFSLPPTHPHQQTLLRSKQGNKRGAAGLYPRSVSLSLTVNQKENVD